MRKRNLSVLGSKSGQWLQLTFVIVLLLGLGVVFLVLTSFSTTLNDELQLEDGISSEGKAVLASHTASTDNFFDSSVAFILGGVWLLCLGLAYNSGGSPMLLVIGLLIIVSLGFVGMIVSNAWDDLASDSSFSVARSNLPITSFLLDNYLSTVLVMGFSVLIVGMSRGGGF